jgi:hypothetical protein
MTRQLTQADFKDVAPWVESMAIDGNGRAWGYAVSTSLLSIDDKACEWIASIGKSINLGAGYDTTNWQHSAIDRE